MEGWLQRPATPSAKDEDLPRQRNPECGHVKEKEGTAKVSERAQHVADALGREADAHFAAQEYQKAYDAYSEAIRVAPSVPLRSGRAAANLLLGRPRAALFEAKAALELDPSSSTGLVKKAQAHLELLEFDKALSDVQLARSACREGQGQLLQALNLLEEAVERRRAVHVCAQEQRAQVSGVPPNACMQQALDTAVACIEETRCSFTRSQRAAARSEALQVLPGLRAVCRGHAAARAAAEALPDTRLCAARRALVQYRASANMGCAEGMYRLALCYRDGLGCKQDSRLFWQWIRKAAVQMPYQVSGCSNPGVAAAENAIGVSYRDGFGVTADAAQALVWFELAAGHGDADGCNNLGCALLQAEDFRSAAREFRKAAEQGHKGAIKNLAKTATLLGDGTDLAKLSFWLENASGEEEVALPMMLTLLQATGSQLLDLTDVDTACNDALRIAEERPDDIESLRWAAALLLHKGQLANAKTHKEALEKKPYRTRAAAPRSEADFPEPRPMTDLERHAFRILKTAARMSDTISQVLLAMLLESTGHWRKAIKWWESAAETCNADAAYRLSVLFSIAATGSTAAADLHKSLAWLEKAVVWGSHTARCEYTDLRDSILRRKVLGNSFSSDHRRTKVLVAKRVDQNWLHDFAAPECSLLKRLSELEEHIALQEEPSRTSLQLLQALNCFEESLYALFSCHDSAVDLLFLAYMYDSKACQLTHGIAQSFAAIAVDRASQSDGALDVPAAVVAFHASCETEYDVEEQASVYTECIDTIKVPPLRKAWAAWLPRFYEMRASCYMMQKCWKEAVEDYAAEAELDPTCCAAIYGIAELYQAQGDQFNARREFHRYLCLSKQDEENRPHAHYKLADLAMRDGDLVETKRQLSLAQHAEEHRLVLLGRLDDQSFPLKSATTESYLARLEGRDYGLSAFGRRHSYGYGPRISSA